MPPEFNLDKRDYGAWIVDKMMGESRSFSASQVMEILKIQSRSYSASQVMEILKILGADDALPVQNDPPEPSDYEKGYKDGKRGKVNSSLKGTAEYDMGWKDGEGDRAYGS